MESKWKQKDYKWNQKDSRKVKEKCSICVNQDQGKDKITKDFQERFESTLKKSKVFVNDHPGHIQHIIQGTDDAGTIQIRNARERNRVRAVNEAFARLRKVIPYTANRNKRVSKVKTLRKAVQYIRELQIQLLDGCCMS